MKAKENTSAHTFPRTPSAKAPMKRGTAGCVSLKDMAARVTPAVAETRFFPTAAGVAFQGLAWNSDTPAMGHPPPTPPHLPSTLQAPTLCCDTHVHDTQDHITVVHALNSRQAINGSLTVRHSTTMCKFEFPPLHILWVHSKNARPRIFLGFKICANMRESKKSHPGDGGIGERPGPES